VAFQVQFLNSRAGNVLAVGTLKTNTVAKLNVLLLREGNVQSSNESAWGWSLLEANV